MTLLDGKATANHIKETIAKEVLDWTNKGNRAPHLAALLVGDDGASQTYVNHKVRACEQVGFGSTIIKMPAETSREELLKQIDRLNADEQIDGFIVQLPLPKHLAENDIINAIDYRKDVDGFHPVNGGRMLSGLPAFLPATPAGILEMIKHYKIETAGKNCVVIGRSNIVGRPMSVLMSRSGYPGNATVTICHSRTPDVAAICKEADIVIAATGRAESIDERFLKEGATVIDVGITRIKDDSKKSGYRLAGDVKFNQVAERCSFITPVPGGVGPMTVVSLLLNTFKAAKKEVYS